MKTGKRQRLEIDIWLYFNGELVSKAKRHLKTRARAFLTEVPNSEWTSGTVKVWYSRPDDHWNAGDFEDTTTSSMLLEQFTEKELVRDFT